MLKIRKSNLNTLVYEVPKTRGTFSLLLHFYEFKLLEQLLKYGYICSVEYIDLFVEIRASEGFNHPKNA